MRSQTTNNLQIDYYYKAGFKHVGINSSLVNVLETTEAKNICMWYDGTMRPHRGHYGVCGWKFDGQVFYHV